MPAPPANRPSTAERDACQPFLHRELEILLPQLRAVVALGSFGWKQLLRVAADLGGDVPRPRPAFGHAVETPVTFRDRTLPVLASYHPSQQNTFTGRLTEGMFDEVWTRAKEVLDA